MTKETDIEYIVVGGGFYGCCLSLFLRSISKDILLIEADQTLMNRASRVNQARIHTGFHYPRSAVTSVKSMLLNRRFVDNFPDAVVDDFQMLYAISRKHSKVSAYRFFRMFDDMGAPISKANATQNAIFDPHHVESVFACTERAFDYTKLREHLSQRLSDAEMEILRGVSVERIYDGEKYVEVLLSNGDVIRAKWVFNVTYSQINHLLKSGSLPQARLKHELTEIALIEPPAELSDLAITVMDGPFFSTMPYPANNLYSLTHVRYTPHRSWTDDNVNRSPYAVLNAYRTESRSRYMICDAKRYVPCLGEAEWRGSLYDVKTVLLKNEMDDGRPILFHRQPDRSRVISILGGKIDNIYDLFDLVRTTETDWRDADERFIYD